MFMNTSVSSCNKSSGNNGNILHFVAHPLLSFHQSMQEMPVTTVPRPSDGSQPALDLDTLQDSKVWEPPPPTHSCAQADLT